MNDIELLLKKLKYFDKKFKFMIQQNKDHLLIDYDELCELMDDYSSFIINRDNEKQWKHIKQSIEILSLIDNLRNNSAVCVQILEKHWRYYES